MAWAYFILILMGSVFLGWHYVLDGIAGLVIAIPTYRAMVLVPKREAGLRPAAELSE